MNRNILKRVLLIIPALLLEIGGIFLLQTVLNPIAVPLYIALRVFGFLQVLYIITKEGEGVYKIIWMLVIMLMPAIGALAYILFGNKRPGRPLKAAIEEGRKTLKPLPAGDKALTAAYASTDKRAMQTFASLERATGYPVHASRGVKYYPLGDDVREDMLTELAKAEKYIFIEYFIVEKGILWDSITEILAKKVAEGVDVRVMYDDLGSIGTFSKEDRAELVAMGVKCVSFNPMVFVLGTLNYRSHRKMMIIDGRVAFSGGINMADEYINQRKHPYGHWKDIAYRIEGGAVNNFTHMFAEFWNGISEDKIDPALLACAEPEPDAPEGLALSFYDSPLNDLEVSNFLIIDLLNQSTDYVWFYTPYLLLGDRLLNALMAAARRGVDVRIIMPGIPDKKMVFRMAHAYYPQLLDSGVRIFEYTPGFVHAKACIVDDKLMTIGTVNLDYRSLFLHYENSTLLYKSPIIPEVKADHLATQEKCREIRLEDLNNGGLTWLLNGLMRIIAPLF